MKKSFLSIVLLVGIVIPSWGIAPPEIKFRPKKAKEDQKFYQEVQPLVEQFVQGILKEDGTILEKLCNAEEKFLFRYVGSYDTTLTCQELGGLFKETKKRWWGRSDGSGLPIIGIFKKIWGDNFKKVAKQHDLRGVNLFMHTGNAIDKPMGDAPFVDLTWSGSKEYEGMDWYSLRLFFDRKNAKWYLKSLDIYHWTI